MFNCKKSSKWIPSNSAIFILVIVGLIISYTWLIASGKSEINITPVIAASIAALLAPWVGVKTFLEQQRIARVQKIYYEESLLEILEHLDKGLNITNQNLARFENVINLIKLNQSYSVDHLKEISDDIKFPTSYTSSKNEIVISLFGKTGYVTKMWLFKLDNDIKRFNLILYELISSLSCQLQASIKISEENLSSTLKKVENEYNLISRHYVLPYLFNAIVSIIGSIDFKSRKELIKDINKNPEINEQLQKIDEAFKVIFAYYKIDEKTLVSYLVSDKGYRFKVTLIDRNNISIERIPKDFDLNSKEFKIVMDDWLLAGLQISLEKGPINYSEIQLGMANKVAFSEPPAFYPKAETFNSF